MRTTDDKVADQRRRPTSVYLTPEDRDNLARLQKLKYHGITGLTTILRLEGMRAVCEEIERHEAEQKEAA